MGVSYSPKIVTDGLVLALDAANPKSYPGSGTTWNDLSGNGNNGTLVNGPTFDSGNNGSIVFDGVNDRVDITSFTSLSQNLTFSLWFNPTSLPSLSNINVLYSIAETETIRLYKNSNFQENNLAWLVYYDRVNESIGAVLPQYTYTTGVWTNTVMTLNESGQYKVYINGNLFSTQNPSNFVRWKLPTGLLRISSTTFPGKTSTFNITEKVLTQQEVLQNYNATKGRFGL